ncbi:hypothetical protein MY3296_007734 [Beauveria thailandica]
MIAAALDDADRDKIATMPRLRRLSSYTTFNPTAFIYGQDPPARSAKSCLVRIRPGLEPSSPLKTTPLDGVITVVLARSREIKGEFWQGRWGVAAKKPSGHVQEYLEDRDFARQDQKFAGAELAEIGYR